MRPTLVARSLVAMVLAFAFLAGFAPLGSTSSVHLCTMECCAFMPTHEAGSCAHGASHAVLPAHPSMTAQPQAELCGTHNETAAQDGDMHRHDDLMPMPADAAPLHAENSSTPAHDAHGHPNDSAAKPATPESAPPDVPLMRAFAKPCPPECGAGTCGSSTQSRPRDDAALAYGDKPRPPSGLSHVQLSESLQTTLDALCRRSRPRGPPSFFS